MAIVKFEGKEYTLPRETDIILECKDKTLTVQCKAKKGLTTYPYFLAYDAMVKAEGKGHVKDKYNEKKRTDAVNGINRPSKTPAEIKALKEKASKVRSTLSEDQQKALDKDLLTVIARYTQEAAQAEATK